MNRDSCFELGYIEKPHGLKGEVQIHLDVDYSEDYSELESVFVEIQQSLVPFFIDTLQIKHNGKALVKFEEIDAIESAQELVGKKLFLPISSLPELGDNKFYYHEIIGFQAEDKTQGDVGVVQLVYERSGQDILSLLIGQKEVLVPITESILLKVDKKNRKILLDIPLGLVDLYLEDNEN